MAEDFNPANAQTPAPAPDNQPPADEEKQPDVIPTPAPDAEQTTHKNKTKAELEAENAALLAEHQRLTAEVEVLRKMLPNYLTAKPGYKIVFIKSDKVAAIPKNGKKYIQGDVNGVKFEVQCDTQTEVSLEVAEALKGVIEAQRH